MQLPASFRLASRFCLLLSVLLSLDPASGGSATWNINPTHDWNTPENWTPRTVPNSPEDVATFALTNVVNPVIHSDVELDTLYFAENAPAPITITVGASASERVTTLTLSGAGIVNETDYRQSYTQTVQAAPTLATNGERNRIYLENDASIIYGGGQTNTQLAAEGGPSPDFVGGQIQFLDNSTAGTSSSAGIIALAGENGGGAGEVWFLDNSSAGASYVVSRAGLEEGSTSGVTYFMGTSTAFNAYVLSLSTQAANVGGGQTIFLDSSTAGDSQVSAYGGAYGENAGGGIVTFSDTASASNAHLFASGGYQGGLAGSFQFLSDSTGGTAQVELTGDASLVIADHNPPGITIGSLSNGDFEGGGAVILGSNNLTVGSNNLSSEFSGVIEGSGSLIKMGTGILTLSGSSTYTGGTTVNAGVLRVTNRTGSATGNGLLNIVAGILAGSGTIAGPVSLGAGTSLSPSLGMQSDHQGSRLSIQSSLRFQTDSTYSCQLYFGRRVSADQVLANRVTIASGAHFQASANGSQTVPLGTSFLVINNQNAQQIGGVFDNLPDGVTVTVNGNNLQANYEGGDGNDLVLTVVP